MIVAEGLTKRYGDHVAVDDVTLTVQPGTVTGFLGPNGAGKSTSMRMMVGLTPPNAGHTLILGRPYAQIPNPGLHVGVLLDASAQHNGRTGREALTLAAMVMGLPATRVNEMLEVVGLTPAEAKRRMGNYSLGDPHVLILDEPANGLDPAGIRWMRGLLRGFADRGGTVLLSSHLLHEVEVIADEIVVIGRGRIVAQGTKQELLRSSSTYVRGLDERQLFEALRVAGLEATPSRQQVGKAAAAAGAVLLELRPADGHGLEEMFLALTADDARERVSEEASA